MTSYFHGDTWATQHHSMRSSPSVGAKICQSSRCERAVCLWGLSLIRARCLQAARTKGPSVDWALSKHYSRYGTTPSQEYQALQSLIERTSRRSDGYSCGTVVVYQPRGDISLLRKTCITIFSLVPSGVTCKLTLK